MADLSHLSIEERLTHIENHIANGEGRIGCALCRRITEGY